MAWYDVRDLLGHFVKPSSREGEMCPHKCCRGRRPHPDRFPIILGRDQLRNASERDLIAHWDKWDHRERVTAQILGEIDRRDKAKATRQRRREREATRDEGYRAYLENEFIQAESATQGQMVNKRGRAKGIDPRSLWTANERTRAAYASEELRRYWDSSPPVSRAEFLDQTGETQTRAGRGRRSSRLYGVY